jgi:serine/threonine protein kinase
LASALNFIHSQMILHRDLKTKNIFLTKGCCKLGDFGIARVLDGTHDSSNTFAGTPFYMSPEALGRTRYGDKADVWSLGCIMYEICTLKQAFDGATLMVVMCAILDGPLPELPERFAQPLRLLVAAMLTRDPDQRLSAANVLASPALEGYPKTRMCDVEYDSKPQVSNKKELTREREEVIANIRNKKLGGSGGMASSSNSSDGSGTPSASQDGKIPPWILEHPDIFPDGAIPTETVTGAPPPTSANVVKMVEGSASPSPPLAEDVDDAETSGSESEYDTAESDNCRDDEDDFVQTPVATPVNATQSSSSSSGRRSFGRMRSDESHLASMMLSSARQEAQTGAGAIDHETAAQAMSYFSSAHGAATGEGTDSGGPPMRLGQRRLSGVLLEAHDVLSARQQKPTEAFEQEHELRELIRSHRTHHDTTGKKAGKGAAVLVQPNGGPSLRFSTGKAAGGGGKGLLFTRRSSHRMDRPEDDYWHIPYYPSIYFTGREKEMDEMREQLGKPQGGITVRIACISYCIPCLLSDDYSTWHLSRFVYVVCCDFFLLASCIFVHSHTLRPRI